MLAYSEETLADNGGYGACRKTDKMAAVTYAVCDSKVNGLDIREHDIIGLLEDDIVVAGADVGQIVKDLLRQMVDDETEIITLYAARPLMKLLRQACRKNLLRISVTTM